ncbi:MAG: GAF domain-containing protein [Candidatus Hodarchaeota archaeon]
MGKIEDILASGKNQNEILKAVADWFVLDFGNIHFAAIYTKQDEKFILVAAGVDNPPSLSEFPGDDSIYGEATKGQRIIIDDVKSKPGADIFFSKSVSTLTMPIMKENDMKGIIHVSSMFISAFKQTDLIFFSRCILKIAEIL